MLELQQASITVANRCLISATSLILYPTTMTALIGPNGAGKTSLLRLLAGLWLPTAGQVKLNGKNLKDFQRTELARQITFVPQEITVQFALTVREIVAMGRYPHHPQFYRSSLGDLESVEKAMIATDTLHLAERAVTQLSAGERQRVALARSLATEAPIILLDEPVAHLDIAHTLTILYLCQKLAQEGKIILFSTHDINIALHYTQQIVVVHQGQLLAQGLPKNLLTPDLIRTVFKVQAEVVTLENSEKVLQFKPLHS